MWDVNSRPDAEIRVVDATEVRVNPKKLRKLSAAKIRQYAHDYDRGCDFPPIMVESAADSTRCVMVAIAFRHN